MTCDYSLTFEFDYRAPVTVRGKVSGGYLRPLVARAVAEAVEAHPGLVWRSVVVVVERGARRQRQETATPETEATA